MTGARQWRMGTVLRAAGVLWMAAAGVFPARADEAAEPAYRQYALPSPPEDLSAMVAATRNMYQAGVSRQKISDWLVKTVDDRILNTNDAAEVLFEPRSLLGIRGFFYGKANVLTNRAIESNANADNYHTIAYRAWKTGLGQCQENANVIYYILKEAGVKENVRIQTAGDAHMYTVWGIQNGANPNQPATWGGDAIVVDSWYGSTLKPEELEKNKWFKNDDPEVKITDQTTYHDIGATPWTVKEENRRQDDPSSCFVATAVYGSPMAAEVQVLREWRDRELAASAGGRAFLSVYGAFGPVLAGWLREHPGYKEPVREWIVQPAVEHARAWREEAE